MHRPRSDGNEIRISIRMYTQSAVLLEGEKSTQFHIGQGVAQGCSMSPILFLSINKSQFYAKNMFSDEITAHTADSWEEPALP